MRNLAYVLSAHKKENVSWGLWKLKTNLLEKRKEQVDNDIKAFETKINNNTDPEMHAIK